MPATDTAEAPACQRIERVVSVEHCPTKCRAWRATNQTWEGDSEPNLRRQGKSRWCSYLAQSTSLLKRKLLWLSDKHPLVDVDVLGIAASI